jgi:hypothetical protein
MPSQVLALKRRDVETAEHSAGHMVAEVWLRQYKKWVFVDGQFGVLAKKGSIPLNAVELQDAIARKSPDLKIVCVSESQGEGYVRWVGPYLHYFDFNLDQRFFQKDYERKRYDPPAGKIMLVPKGAKEPKVFQRKLPIKNCTYITLSRKERGPEWRLRM